MSDEIVETIEVELEKERETTESYVKGVENAAESGLLSRKQAERVISSGQKANRSHDLVRGLRGF